ncbi:helix-turn-helix domain-containing protein, partial [Rhodoplanes sp. SY1]|uniref:helix-turn-helix domain-containing protein n=1 Tax=Rhodoplanes sp. SY1 TaxID=3166646 RepID=UPI0038B4F77E
ENGTAPLVYDVIGAAKAAGISRSALYNELKAGRIVGRKFGSRTLIEHAEIARFVASLPVMTPRQ